MIGSESSASRFSFSRIFHIYVDGVAGSEPDDDRRSIEETDAHPIDIGKDRDHPGNRAKQEKHGVVMIESEQVK